MIIEYFLLPTQDLRLTTRTSACGLCLLPFCLRLTPYFSNFVSMKIRTDIQELEQEEVLTETTDPFHLVVWNDEVNTFEWVIETLMDVCKHSYEQAEQCAYIVHFKGKYAVKNGTYDELKPMCDAITERGIGATVETVV